MDTDNPKLSEALSWDELADLYDERTGGTARTRPMEEVFEWGKRQDDLVVHPEKDTIHYTLVTKVE